MDDQGDDFVFELREGDRLKLPNGVPVTAYKSDLLGPAWELRSPGGWATWGVDPAGTIQGFSLAVRRRYTMRPTGWTVADLVADEGPATATSPS